MSATGFNRHGSLPPLAYPDTPQTAIPLLLSLLHEGHQAVGKHKPQPLAYPDTPQTAIPLLLPLSHEGHQAVDKHKPLLWLTPTHPKQQSLSSCPCLHEGHILSVKQIPTHPFNIYSHQLKSWTPPSGCNASCHSSSPSSRYCRATGSRVSPRLPQLPMWSASWPCPSVERMHATVATSALP